MERIYREVGEGGAAVACWVISITTDGLGNPVLFGGVTQFLCLSCCLSLSFCHFTHPPAVWGWRSYTSTAAYLLVWKAVFGVLAAGIPLEHSAKFFPYV
jgi:hypothetical protein